MTPDTPESVSFAPLLGPSVHTLILGTMPGKASLSAAQYYAHPRNALWPVLHALITGDSPSFRIHQSMDYATRCSLLTSHGYALWDVLLRCDRLGSLDSNIVRASEVPNDIARLVKQHPELRCIACNGKSAETLFKRHIQRTLPDRARVSAGKKCVTDAINSGNTSNTQSIRIVTLPSTSPAMASLTLEQKYQRWAAGLLG